MKFGRSPDLIVKVKGTCLSRIPQNARRPDSYTYLHLAPDAKLTQELLKRKVTGIAYETITNEEGHLPLLTPMSEAAGRMSVQVGAFYLQRTNGGRGVLLGGVPGVLLAQVAIVCWRCCRYQRSKNGCGTGRANIHSGFKS